MLDNDVSRCTFHNSSLALHVACTAICRAGGWKTKNAKIVSNFLSRPVPLRLRRNVWKQGSVHVDVYARLAVLSHRCHKQRWWMGTVLGTEAICFAPTGLVCKCRAQAGLLRTQTLVSALAVFIVFWAQHGPPGGPRHL